MAKSKGCSSCNVELASYILGVIGLIWSAFTLVASILYLPYISDIQDLIVQQKYSYIEEYIKDIGNDYNFKILTVFHLWSVSLVFVFSISPFFDT